MSVTEEWTKLRNNKGQRLWPTPTIIRVIQSRRMIQACDIARLGKYDKKPLELTRGFCRGVNEIRDLLGFYAAWYHWTLCEFPGVQIADHRMFACQYVY